MATLNLGRVRFNWRGEYAADANYLEYDCVESDGQSYACIEPVKGVEPGSAGAEAYWDKMLGRPASFLDAADRAESAAASAEEDAQATAADRQHIDGQRQAVDLAADQVEQDRQSAEQGAQAAASSAQQADDALAQLNNQADIATQAAAQAEQHEQGAAQAQQVAENAAAVSQQMAVAVTPTAFAKADGSLPAWNAPSSTTLEAASDLALVVGSSLVEIAAGTSVTLPALSNGTDYTVYAHGDGTLEAVDADSAAPAGARTVGGFHSFANGGIASRSLWDLNWRPSAPSPRAMVHDPKCGIWADIYLMDTQYGVNGYSRNGAQIADANSAPVIPDAYGGDGSSTYANLSWWVAADLATAAGKRLPFYQEFASIAYGVVERQAVGTDPGTTQHQAGHRSDIGCEQIAGVMWQWGADINGTSATGAVAWQDWADGRGDIYTNSIRAPLFGASWSGGSYSGSRASHWNYQPDRSNSDIGARGVCDHMNLQAER